MKTHFADGFIPPNDQLEEDPLTSNAVVAQKQRIVNDYYPTPRGITEALLQILPPEMFEHFFEPCAGNGAIAEVLMDAGMSGVQRDIAWNITEPKDATQRSFWEYHAANLPKDEAWATVTNPPFNQAENILPLAFEFSPICCFLLRISYMEPTKGRADFLRETADHLRFFAPVNPRGRFRRDSKKGDNATTAWFIWDKSWSWQSKGIISPFQFVTKWRQH